VIVIAGPADCFFSGGSVPGLSVDRTTFAKLFVDSKKSLATPRIDGNSVFKKSSEAEHDTSKLPTLIEIELTLTMVLS
jgi:hypothetical protein